MLDSIVAIGVLDDFIKVLKHLSQDHSSLITISLVFSHDVLEDTETILMVDHLDEIVHDSFDHKCKSLLRKARDYLLDQMGALTIEHQLYHVVPDGFLNKLLLLTGANE